MGLVRFLQSKGHTVDIVAPEDKYSAYLQSNCDGFYPIKMQNTGSNPLADLWLLWQLLKCYNAIKPDVLLNFTIKPNIYGTLAARILGIPSINNVSGLGTIFLNGGLSSLIAKWLYRVAFRGNTHIFFQNAQDQADFNHHVKSNASQAVIPGSGIDLHKFSPPVQQPSNPSVVFLFIGRLLIDKGVLEYLEAAKSLLADGQKAIFKIAGEFDEKHVRGIKRNEMESYTDVSGIEYLGHVSNVADYIAMADWVVLPSYREGTSRILLEAAAMGKPIVTTDVPGCNNVVEHGRNGYLCQPRDMKALKNALLAAIHTDAITISKLGAESRQIAENRFDEHLVFEAYLYEINRICKVL